jgi:hypothetical protein
MNIFFIHENPVLSAKAMSNRHIVKMIIESAQLMSTAHYVLDNNTNLYRPTHTNHPSAVWTRLSAHNYTWLYRHFLALCEEYTLRYNREHLTYTKLQRALRYPPLNIPVGTFTQPPQAMPDIYKQPDSVVAYRLYYSSEKLFTKEDHKRYDFYIGLDNYLKENYHE